MAASVLDGKLFGDVVTFRSTLSTTIDLGTDPGRWALVAVYVPTITVNTHIQTVTVGGVSLTKEADEDHNQIAAGAGRIAWFRSDTATLASMPTGVQTVLVTCANADSKIQAFVMWGDGATALGAAPSATKTSSGFGAKTSQTVTSDADSVVVGLGSIGGTEVITLTASSPTVVYGGSGTGIAWQFGTSEPGSASVIQEATMAGSGSTPWIGWRSWNVQGAGGGATAPTIDTQPTAQTVTAPTAATFTASVGGTFTGLRWQRQAAGAGAWNDISGATSTTLTTGATSVTGGSWNNTDRVRLAVDWSGGTVLSNDVALTVNAAGTAPSITTQPRNTSVTVGSTAGFTVAATGSGTLTYQWQREPAAGGGFTNISGAVSASYTTPATSISGGSANNGDKYRCVVTGDTSPPATSNQATLTVLQPLATSITFTINGATSLTGLKWAVFEGLTPDAWVAPIAKGAAETTNGSDVCTVSIAGVTTKRVGDLACVVVTNSDGTATGGSQAATRRMAYYIGACA